MILDLCLLKGGVPMDVISEIIAYEKHAEEIVAQAKQKSRSHSFRCGGSP
ncbi:hypothetical protein LEA_20806 [human gut metagenome]|uniref:Uncharacterized protein n=1 Tax=human gut metagenome TaxID=408170 RepID=K1RRN5_9ZZZZ